MSRMLRTESWAAIALCAGILSVGAAAWLYRWVLRQDAGSARAQEVASWIRQGARAYLRRLYMALTLVAVAMGFIIAIVFGLSLIHI